MPNRYTARFPLEWPPNWPRSRSQKSAPFRIEPARAEKDLLEQLRLMGASQIIVSSNRRTNRDGNFSVARQAIFDKGIAVYFKRKGRDVVLACDQYEEIHENVRAIGKTLEALRGIERWGASDMLDKAFTGFEALPPPEPWWETLGVRQDASPEEIRRSYIAKMRAANEAVAPDSVSVRINLARDEARKAGRL